MQAAQFLRTVTADKANLLDRVLKLLSDNAIRFCVIGGMAVNAYAEPLVSLDFDLVIAHYQLGRFESLLASTFLVKRAARVIEVTLPDSSLRVNIQTDARYAGFVERAVNRPLMGFNLPVAAIEDVLQGKIWACQDATRRAVKRHKDLVDIERLIETRPALRLQVPDEILKRLLAMGA